MVCMPSGESFYLGGKELRILEQAAKKWGVSIREAFHRVIKQALEQAEKDPKFREMVVKSIKEDMEGDHERN